MFDGKKFLATVHDGKIKDALNMLKGADAKDEKDCSAEAIAAIKAIHPKINDTLLHQLAQSVALNEALGEKSAAKDDAQLLLKLVMQHSIPTTQNKPLGYTAFAMAISCDHRAIADAIYLKTCAHLQDAEGNTPLHHAVSQANHVLVNKILQDDDNKHSLYFTRNKKDLYSLALALEMYRKNASALSLSMVNQLYFSLPSGGYRSYAVELDMPVPWSRIQRPFWKHVLYMCGNRDKENTVTSIDLNLWDLVVDVVNKGLNVYGGQVTFNEVYWYSESASGTPGHMLRHANAIRGAGFAGRTLAQTAVNSTLGQNQEFMKRVHLGQAKYTLCHIEAKNFEPEDKAALSNRFLHTTDWVILSGDRLFYIPPREEKADAVCKEIKKDNLGAKNQPAYETVKTILSQMQINTQRAAKPDEYQTVMRILPLVDVAWGARASFHSLGRMVGMTLYARPPAQAAGASPQGAPAAAGAGAGAPPLAADAKHAPRK